MVGALTEPREDVNPLGRARSHQGGIYLWREDKATQTADSSCTGMKGKMWPFSLPTTPFPLTWDHIVLCPVPDPSIFPVSYVLIKALEVSLLMRSGLWLAEPLQEILAPVGEGVYFLFKKFNLHCIFSITI